MTRNKNEIKFTFKLQERRHHDGTVTYNFPAKRLSKLKALKSTFRARIRERLKLNSRRGEKERERNITIKTLIGPVSLPFLFPFLTLKTLYFSSRVKLRSSITLLHILDSLFEEKKRKEKKKENKKNKKKKKTNSNSKPSGEMGRNYISRREDEM